MFICEIWLFDCIFLNSAHLICRSTDISKCFRGSLSLRDNESRLYMCVYLEGQVCGEGTGEGMLYFGIL